MHDRDTLLHAIQSQQPVSGLTHNFYKYPARFSPLFARQAILSFTKPGDFVFDPFMGGGTTLVEAKALGRHTAGSDVSSLAVFISETKTTSLADAQLLKVRQWATQLIPKLNLHARHICNSSNVNSPYQQNITGKKTWHVRKILQMALPDVAQLTSVQEQRFARCVLLRTAQWALDCRENIPRADEIREQLLILTADMIEGARQYRETVLRNGGDHNPAVCLHRSAVGIEIEDSLRTMGPPTLILTSPPYPGVHVLYHRWQILGRRETPAPFWIADTLDGAGSSYYTFGDRKQKDLRGYYEKAAEAFSSIAKIANRHTIIVQMLAFAEPQWQLPQYLDMMGRCGFKEKLFSNISNGKDGRVWRRVPNRKWYADKKGATGGSNEVVLFHQV